MASTARPNPADLDLDVERNLLTPELAKAGSGGLWNGSQQWPNARVHSMLLGSRASFHFTPWPRLG